MGIGAALLAGIALGLGSGSTCFWTCASVMAPLLVSTQPRNEGRRWATVGPALAAIMAYNLGRLCAYLAVCSALLLFAGARLPRSLEAGALFAMAGVLSVSVARPNHGSDGGGCVRANLQARLPTIARHRLLFAATVGLLQGLMPCPPFVAAAGLVLERGSWALGLSLFLGLFAGSSVYSLPLTLLEPLRQRRGLFVAMRAFGALTATYLVARAVRVLLG